jgi:hypothetical protein
MMRFRMLVLPAVLFAVALPAQARAGGFSGIVIAKQPQRGTLLLAADRGVGLTVRGGLARTTVGERVALQGTRLRDGTVRLSRLRVLAHARRATLRGTVLRTFARGTLLASGRSVVLIHRLGRHLASADDHGGLRPGDIGEFRVRFDDDDVVETAPPAQVGQATTARIEGSIVSLSPFVVSLDRLPLTITVPPGTALPASLAAGQRIELTVQVGAANALTLVSVGEVEDENANPGVQAQEIEAKGFVTSSTTAQLVVDANGMMFSFVAQPEATLPVIPVGTFVEVRGLQQNGTITLSRLRVEDGNSGDSGSGDGGDDGGGHH